MLHAGKSSDDGRFNNHHTIMSNPIMHVGRVTHVMIVAMPFHLQSFSNAMQGCAFWRGKSTKSLMGYCVLSTFLTMEQTPMYASSRKKVTYLGTPMLSSTWLPIYYNPDTRLPVLCVVSLAAFLEFEDQLIIVGGYTDGIVTTDSVEIVEDK